MGRASRRIAGVQSFLDLLVTEREGFEPSVPQKSDIKMDDGVGHPAPGLSAAVPGRRWIAQMQVVGLLMTAVNIFVIMRVERDLSPG